MTKPSLDGIFKPQSVAVVGASNRPGNIGREIVHNLIEFEFQGPVFPVNPKLRTLHSLKAYPSVDAIPDPVDLAVIVVPKEQVSTVVEACGRKGVKGLVVITAGFREVGGLGIAREEELASLLNRHGMRMVGPNCMGVINTDPTVRLDASFARTLPITGDIGFMTQSGALGEAILSIASRKGIGFSMFVSVGNKTDVSGNDLLLYWENDPATRVILLYLENFGDPRRFTTIARRITRTKPIVAVKAGRTTAGARAVSSHTGSLAGRDMATDLLLTQCGVLRAASVEELFDLAPAFSMQPPPAGPRVGIVTNAGGPGILATDACVGLGLVVESPSPATRERLAPILHPEASLENPIDLLASGTPEMYGAATRAALDDPAFDALIVIFVPPVMTRSEEVARSIANEAAGSPKPVMVCFMGAEEGVPGVAELRSRGLPVYTFPESAANALAALHTYRQWRDRPDGRVIDMPVDHERAARALESAREAGRDWLTGPEAREVASAARLPVAVARTVRSPAEAMAASVEIGFPLVLKRDGPGSEHKSDSGGVRVGIRNAPDLEAAFHDLGGGIEPLVLMEMIEGGRELILGMIIDPMAGPLLMVGTGGTYVELLRDAVWRIHPLTDLDASEMLRTMTGYPILTGYRGEVAVDTRSVESDLLRLSALVSAFPEIVELDINPYIARPGDGMNRIVDIRIRRETRPGPDQPSSRDPS
ncbi:MAG: acetate--CoA ligase family protein [Candidatus Eisenbacteria bacterium]|nr:acetate--CoA ligase family protein [Candidatus Eisenbacteria bacterium]